MTRRAVTADEVREIRTRHGLTLAAFAEEVGCGVDLICGLEAGGDLASRKISNSIRYIGLAGPDRPPICTPCQGTGYTQTGPRFGANRRRVPCVACEGRGEAQPERVIA